MGLFRRSPKKSSKEILLEAFEQVIDEANRDHIHVEVNMPEQPPINVEVNVPEQPAPVVHVKTPEVKPEITVQSPDVVVQVPETPQEEKQKDDDKKDEYEIVDLIRDSSGAVTQLVRKKEKK